METASSGTDTVPHPLPRMVGTRRGGEMVQAEILHRTRARWPGRNKTRNRILRAGTSAEGCRGIPRKRGSGGGPAGAVRRPRDTPGGVLPPLPPWAKEVAPQGENLQGAARRVVAPLQRLRQITAKPDGGRGKPLPYEVVGKHSAAENRRAKFCEALRRVVAPYRRHGPWRAGGHMGPPLLCCPGRVPKENGQKTWENWRSSAEKNEKHP